MEYRNKPTPNPSKGFSLRQEEIKDILIKSIKKNNKNLVVDGEKLREVHWIISRVHLYRWRRRSNNQAIKNFEEMLNCLDKLKNLLRSLSSSFSYNLFPDRVSVVDVKVDIDKLYEFISDIQPSLSQVPMPKTTRVLWHLYAPLLARCFDDLTYPRRFGLSHKGPKSTFVANMVERLTGEKPEVGAVAKHLKTIQVRP